MEDNKLPEINHDYDSDTRYWIESRAIMAIPYLVALIAIGSMYFFTHIVVAFDDKSDPKVIGVVLFLGFIYLWSHGFTKRLLSNSEYRARIRAERKNQVIWSKRR
jgi:hypothetical protein